MHPLFRASFFFLIIIMFSCDNEAVIHPDKTVVDADTTTAVVDNEPPSVVPDSSIDSAIYHAVQSSILPYRIMLPKDYDSTKTYPLVLFLHGISERGTDNKKQLNWGSSIFQADSIRSKYPSFVVFPQCPDTHYWHFDVMLRKLKMLTDDLQGRYPIDSDRMYIEGMSMGAYGTYAMVAEYPDLFAAAVAISGDGDKTKAKKMAKVHWKIYAGGRDDIVHPGKSKKMADALKKAGASVSFKVYPNADHEGSWVNAFAEPDYFSWVFSKSK